MNWKWLVFAISVMQDPCSSEQTDKDISEAFEFVPHSKLGKLKNNSSLTVNEYFT
jgi:hypothetical protein